MGYLIGVSSGTFGIARSASPETAMEYMGISRKVFYSMFKGVNFTQIDLETISELGEPGLKEKMEKVKGMGMKFGIHGETTSLGSMAPLLDSAIISDYRYSHERFIKSLNGSGKIGAEYFLLHASETPTFIELWKALQPTTICDIWGRPLSKFLDENPDVAEWAIQQEYIRQVGHWTAYIKKEEIENIEKSEKLSKENKEKKMLDIYVNALKTYTTVSDEAYGTERIAYYIIAKWMESGKNCPSELRSLWKDITKGGSIDNRRFRESYLWVPAVSAAYTWGHLMQDRCPSGLQYDDPKKILEKYKMYFVLETAMSKGGAELYYRLARPSHMVKLAKAIASPWIGITIDFEHVLGAGVDPKKDIELMGRDDGKYVKVLHVGYPTPLQPAHMPIPVGSEAQLWLYERMWELRQKGFKDGYIIFERGGGKDPIKQSINALRLIVKYLEMDVPPKELPEEFYGMPKGGPEMTRQLLTIKQHALDPLKGLLAIPEEEYTFLGTAPASKGKAKEWEKEKYK